MYWQRISLHAFYALIEIHQFVKVHNKTICQRPMSVHHMINSRKAHSSCSWFPKLVSILVWCTVLTKKTTVKSCCLAWNIEKYLEEAKRHTSPLGSVIACSLKEGFALCSMHGGSCKMPHSSLGWRERATRDQYVVRDWYGTPSLVLACMSLVPYHPHHQELGVMHTTFHQHIVTAIWIARNLPIFLVTGDFLVTQNHC